RIDEAASTDELSGHQSFPCSFFLSGDEASEWCMLTVVPTCIGLRRHPRHTFALSENPTNSARPFLDWRDNWIGLERPLDRFVLMWRDARPLQSLLKSAKHFGGSAACNLHASMANHALLQRAILAQKKIAGSLNRSLLSSD